MFRYFLSFLIRNIRGALVLAATSALVACGATTDGTSDATSVANGSVSLIVTDAFNEDFAEVWVSLRRVSLQESQDRESTIFEEPDGRVVNLSQLFNVGELVGAQTVPAGAYVGAKLVLADEAKLVTPDGAVITATLGGDGIEREIVVVGAVNVEPGKLTTTALDFDLPHFRYDAATNIVTPVIVLKGAQSVADFKRTFVRLNATVSAIEDAGHLRVTTAGAVALDVYLQPDALLLTEVGSFVPGDARDLLVGARLRIIGAYDPATAAISASRLVVLNDFSAQTGMVEVEGKVVSYDGATLTLNVTYGDVLPASDDLAVINVSNAPITNGDLMSVGQVGQFVEVRGYWDGVMLNAEFIAIEDASDDVVLDPGYSSDVAPPLPEWLRETSA